MPSSDSIPVADPSSTRMGRRRRWRSPALLIVKRLHLYLGLLLMPWALLYGISGYLFNHPTHFQGPSLRAFGPSVVRGTALEQGLDANRCAEQILEGINARLGQSNAVVLDTTTPPLFAGDYLFASAETESQKVQLLLYRDGSGGTLHVANRPKVQDVPPESARFDIAPNRLDRKLEPREDASTSPSQGLSSDAPLRIEALDPEPLLAAVESIAAKLDTKFASLKFRVTSVPELQLQIRDGKQTWISRYNASSGALTSKPAPSELGALPTWRRFLTRMHTTHGYPLDHNARWIWAVVVDVMSGVLVFWGISGLFMWWQIKGTRPWGTVALVVSVLFAIGLGASMMVGMR